jgi:ABC-type ATPase with predicted acetyltransferase domain
VLELNAEFPLVKALFQDLSKDQKTKLKLLIRMINTTVNKIRQTHEDGDFAACLDDQMATGLAGQIKTLMKNGWTRQQIQTDFIDALGLSTESLPADIFE